MKIDWRNSGAVIENTLRASYIEACLARIGSVGMLLDLGCGDRPFEDLYNRYAERAVGVDIDTEYFSSRRVDVFCSATELRSAFMPGSFDVVLCAEVMHDVQDPSRMLQEIHAITKAGGFLILTTPFMVPICDGEYDHYRYTKHGLRHLLERARWEILEIRPVGDLIASTITLAIKPILRAISLAAKRMRMPWLYSRFNPLVFILAILPQLAYLGLCRLATVVPPLMRVMRSMDYAATGYVCIAMRLQTQSELVET